MSSTLYINTPNGTNCYHFDANVRNMYLSGKYVRLIAIFQHGQTQLDKRQGDEHLNQITTILYPNLQSIQGHENRTTVQLNKLATLTAPLRRASSHPAHTTYFNRTSLRNDRRQPHARASTHTHTHQALITARLLEYCVFCWGIDQHPYPVQLRWEGPPPEG